MPKLRTIARITIDPKIFSEGEWAELFNCNDSLGLMYEDRADAVAISRCRDAVEQAAHDCRAKIERIQHGELGAEDEPGDDARWCDDLRNAAIALEGLLAK